MKVSAETHETDAFRPVTITINIDSAEEFETIRNGFYFLENSASTVAEDSLSTGECNTEILRKFGSQVWSAMIKGRHCNGKFYGKH